MDQGTRTRSELGYPNIEAPGGLAFIAEDASG